MFHAPFLPARIPKKRCRIPQRCRRRRRRRRYRCYRSGKGRFSFCGPSSYKGVRKNGACIIRGAVFRCSPWSACRVLTGADCNLQQATLCTPDVQELASLKPAARRISWWPWYWATRVGDANNPGPELADWYGSDGPDACGDCAETPMMTAANLAAFSLSLPRSPSSRLLSRASRSLALPSLSMAPGTAFSALARMTRLTGAALISPRSTQGGSPPTGSSAKSSRGLTRCSCSRKRTSASAILSESPLLLPARATSFTGVNPPL